MAKHKKTIIKEELNKRIFKYDEQRYLVFVPSEHLHIFNLRFIKNNKILKQYAQHWKLQKKQRKGSRINTNNYQIYGYDYLFNKTDYDSIYEFYYDLLSRMI